MKSLISRLLSSLILCGVLFSPASDVFAQSFTQVTVGLAHLCGLSAGGSVDCRTQPHAIRYDSPVDLPPLIAITAGHQHTCGIDYNGAVICWGGENHFNQLDVPAFDQPVVNIEAGVNHTCAVDASNRAWCWGLDSNNQTQVPGNGLGSDETGFVSVTANANASCGLKTTGGIECWSTDTFFTNTSSLTGTFIDLDLSGPIGCGLRDDGSIQCWATSFPPPTNGPYSAIVATYPAICGLNSDQQLDCSVNPRATSNSARYSTETRFSAVESGKLYSSINANICGVTVDGAIECIGADALPDVPGTAIEDTSQSLDIGLNARIYNTNSIELFWKPSRNSRPRFVEVYRDEVLVDTTNASFSWYDSSEQQKDTVKYTVRAVDEFGIVGPLSNAVYIDNTTLSVSNESLLSIDENTTILPVHPVDRLSVVSLATEIIILWDGNTPGTDGLKGYEVTVNNEIVALTTNTFFTSSKFINGICNTVVVASIAEDGTRLSYETDRFFRTRVSFGSSC